MRDKQTSGTSAGQHSCPEVPVKVATSGACALVFIFRLSPRSDWTSAPMTSASRAIRMYLAIEEKKAHDCFGVVTSDITDVRAPHKLTSRSPFVESRLHECLRRKRGRLLHNVEMDA